MDYTLRKAVPDDYPDVNALATELMEFETDRQAMFAAALARPDRTFLVAEVGGEVVGFADLDIYPDVAHGARSSDLRGLVVRGDHRRKGLGRALLREAYRIACEAGVREFHICTEQDNLVAQRLYSSIGAGIVGVQMAVDL